MEDNDRPRKRQKLFQGSLPAEMIENILNYCSCLITLESLACTCKQINALVSNIFKNSVVMRVQLINDTYEKKTAKYVINGNGDAFKRTKYSRNPPGFTNEKINLVQKKLDDRFKLDKFVSKLLNIINMTDWSKLKELLAKLESNQLLELGHDKVVFDIQVDTQRIRYLHIDEDASIRSNEEDENLIMNSEHEDDSGDDKPVRRKRSTNGKGQANSVKKKIGSDNNDADSPSFEKDLTSEEQAEDPDLDTVRREDWNELDEMMIKRLKCALCVLKMKKFYSNIHLDRKKADQVSISYGSDEISHDGWEVHCYDSGYVYGEVTDWSDRQWNFRDEKQLATIQYRPSFAKLVFEKVRTYIQTYIEKEHDNKNSEGNTEDNDKNNNENDEDDSKGNEKDEQSNKETRSRSVQIVLNGTQYSYQKMSDEDLKGLMDTLIPLTLPLGLDFEY